MYGLHKCPISKSLAVRNKGTVHTHSFTPHIEANNSLFLKDLMLQGQGICLLPSFLIEAEVKAQRVVHLLPNYSLAPGKGWIVYRIVGKYSSHSLSRASEEADGFGWW